MRTTRRSTPLVITNDESYVRPTHHLQFTIGGWKQNPIFSGSLEQCIAYSDEYCNGDGNIVEDGALIVDYLNDDEVVDIVDQSSKINKIFMIIFIGGIFLSLIILAIGCLLLSPSKELGDVFGYCVIIFLASLIGMYLSINF